MARYREVVIEGLTTGRWNRLLGWLMLLVGWGLVAILDPYLLTAPLSPTLTASVRWSLRHFLGVMLAMGVLQLAVSHLCETVAFQPAARRTAALLTMVGAMVYTTGYGVGEAGGGLVLAGSACNLVGLASLLWGSPHGEYTTPIRMVLPVACFGMILDFGAGVLVMIPESWGVDYLGDGEGVRLRMLRLARVASIALSVLTLLYFGVAHRVRPAKVGVSRIGYLLASGAMGMPTVLAAACFTSLSLKYLLPLPAIAVCVGVSCGLLLATNTCRPLEIWGWSLIVASTSVGMLMGFYAFDGPFASPSFLGSYSDLPRGLSRLAHSYSIVLGMLAIFLARECEAGCPAGGRMRWGGVLVTIGSTLTLITLIAHLLTRLPPWTLTLGPTGVVVGSLFCLARPWFMSRLHAHGEPTP